MLLPTSLQYRLLKWIAPAEPQHMNGSAYIGRSKLRVLLGEELIEDLRGKRVIDFGCGDGAEAVDLAKNGARHVCGIDIRKELLEAATRRAQSEGVADRCEFSLTTPEKVDAIVTIDAFEHFADPAAILQTMHDLLLPGGFVAASFGPTWLHPLGGHLFSMIPWAHLIFSEKALIRWRADIRNDGATRFAEVLGGLNQMTIGRFERLVRDSPFDLEYLETIPIRRLAPLHGRLTREFTTAVVRAKLVKTT
jgi:SAM-dependent methyltransferase